MAPGTRYMTSPVVLGETFRYYMRNSEGASPRTSVHLSVHVTCSMYERVLVDYARMIAIARALDPGPWWRLTRLRTGKGGSLEDAVRSGQPHACSWRRGRPSGMES